MEVLDGFEFQIVIEQICSPDNLPITLSVFYRIAGLTICPATVMAMIKVDNVRPASPAMPVRKTQSGNPIFSGPPVRKNAV